MTSVSKAELYDLIDALPESEAPCGQEILGISPKPVGRPGGDDPAGLHKINLAICLKIAIFLFKKMNQFRKIPTEREMIDQLRRGEVELPPLSFRYLEDRPEVGNLRFDALIEASWGNSIVKFAVECKSLSTPKAFQDGINLLKTSSFPKDYRPLLFLPFLSDRQLQELEREEIGGIDLCGNGVVVVPGTFAVFRSGEKNRFPSSAPIKNIYRMKSSMVGRVFLIRSAYETVQEIFVEINRRNMFMRRWDTKPMSFSTVSKSLKTLEEDLIVERNKIIRLLQPDKLLEKLSENYATPNIRERVRLKIPESGSTLLQLVQRASASVEVAVCGNRGILSYAICGDAARGYGIYLLPAGGVTAGAAVRKSVGSLSEPRTP